MIEHAVLWLLALVAAPAVGLTSVFLVCLISATLIPMGSEPAVFAVVKANPAMFWPVMLVATIGNTMGGMIDYWMGHHAKKAFCAERATRWFGFLQRFGPKSMLLSWLPIIGDPMCTLAGWLQLPFWPSVLYMAIGKAARYIVITALLMFVPNGFWHGVAKLLA